MASTSPFLLPSRSDNSSSRSRRVNDLFNNGPPLAHSSVEDPIPWEFQHSCFRRDRPDVLVNIKRKSSKAPVPTVLPRRSKSGSNSGSNHSSTAAAELGLVDSGNAGASSSTGEHLYGQFGGASSSRDRGPQGEFSQRTTPFNATSDRNSAPPYPPLPRLPSGTPSYPSPSTRPSQIGGNDDTLAAISRQLVGLETHVRGLSEALYQSQQEAMVVRQEAAVERAGSYAVLRTLLNVVAGMDSSEERREDSAFFSLFRTRLELTFWRRSQSNRCNTPSRNSTPTLRTSRPIHRSTPSSTLPNLSP